VVVLHREVLHPGGTDFRPGHFAHIGLVSAIWKGLGRAGKKMGLPQDVGISNEPRSEDVLPAKEIREGAGEAS